MNAEMHDLLSLLSGSQQFEVPLYQRRYSWTNDDRQKLWNDILAAGRDPGRRKHFVGSVVYTQPAVGMGGSGFRRARLIDGQQRLTTLTLVITALVERLERDGDLELPLGSTGEIEKVRAVKWRELYLLNEDLSGESRFKLLPTHVDRDTFKHLVGGGPLPDRPSAEVLAALAFFRERFADASVTLREVLIGLRKLEVVAVVLHEGRDDPQLIFESLNSTGKDLTPADLIRNNVLMGLEPDEQDDLSRTYWLPMEALFEGSGPDTFNRFMRDFLTVRTRTLVDQKEVYATFKAYRETLGDQGVLPLVADIRRMAQHYAVMVRPEREVSPPLAPALRLALRDLLSLRVRVISPFVLELLEDHGKNLVSTDDLVSALRAVESILVRRAVSEYRSNPLNKLFVGAGRELLRDQGSAAYLRSVERALMRFQDRNRSGFPSDEVFTEKLQTVNLYTLDVCKHVLVRLERAMSPKELVVTDDLTIEHVLPQNRDLSAPWRGMLGEDWAAVQERVVDTLGNLTLTGYNSELGDRPFKAKKTLPPRAGDTEGSALPKGYRYSRLLLTQQIVDEPSWDEATIVKRAARLAGTAVTLWPLPSFTPQELESLRSDGRRAGSRDAWERLQALPLPLAEVVAELNGRMENRDGCTRRTSSKSVTYHKGNRYFLYLSTDDSELRLWALLGKAPHSVHPGWVAGKDQGWWRISITTVDGLNAIWNDLMTAWAKLPDVATGSTDPQNIEADLLTLEGETKSAFETFERELLQVSSTLERRVNQLHIGYGLPVEVTGLMRSGYVQVEVRPPDPDLIPAVLFSGWEDRSKERRAMNLLTPADVERALPLIRAVHDQVVSGIPYRQPQVRALVRDLRLTFRELEPDIKTTATRTAERFLRGEKDIARVYINADDVVVLLRHLYSALENPQGVGAEHDGEPFAGWPAQHFEGRFSTPADLDVLRPLIEQTVRANGA